MVFITNTPFVKKVSSYGGAFYFAKKWGLVMEYEKKIIYCPKCGEKVATYDGKSTINVISRCNKCYKRIVYNVKTKEVIRKDIPPRATSSGTRFY